MGRHGISLHQAASIYTTIGTSNAPIFIIISRSNIEARERKITNERDKTKAQNNSVIRHSFHEWTSAKMLLHLAIACHSTEAIHLKLMYQFISHVTFSARFLAHCAFTSAAISFQCHSTIGFDLWRTPHSKLQWKLLNSLLITCYLTTFSKKSTFNEPE